ncbi:MAG: MBL fold metallo-hydrolase, partial [Dehalococcoidia bacterium]|nr:MBL fold metallo-hydrolase [Dehalococcoidia bacterium]
SIDLLVLTHPQDDHIAGLVEVLKRYKVEKVLESGFEYEIPAYTEWVRLVEEKGIARTLARSGQRIDMGEGIIIDVLHPSDEFVEGAAYDVNNSSVVLRLTQGRINFLFTGDIGMEAERNILHNNRQKLRSTVLKVAHHGSHSSTSDRFLNVVHPQVAVISVGEDNRFGHPDVGVMERLIKQLGVGNIYLTPERGTVTFTTDGEKLWLETEKSSGWS